MSHMAVGLPKMELWQMDTWTKTRGFFGVNFDPYPCGCGSKVGPKMACPEWKHGPKTCGYPYPTFLHREISCRNRAKAAGGLGEIGRKGPENPKPKAVLHLTNSVCLKRGRTCGLRCALTGILWGWLGLWAGWESN